MWSNIGYLLPPWTVFIYDCTLICPLANIQFILYTFMSVLFSSFCRPQSLYQDLDLWCGTLSNVVWKCKFTLFTAWGQSQNLPLNAGGCWINKYCHFMVRLSVTLKLLQIWNFDRNFKRFCVTCYTKFVCRLVVAQIIRISFSNHLSVAEKKDRGVKYSWLSITQDWTVGLKNIFSHFLRKNYCSKGLRYRSIWLLYLGRSRWTVNEYLVFFEKNWLNFNGFMSKNMLPTPICYGIGWIWLFRIK